MTITFGRNISSLQAQQRLNEATSAVGKLYQQLSSGQRINSASDDAAGLAIASQLNAKSAIYGVAARNAQDGISALNVAQGALETLNNVLDRMSELAEQSANGSYSSVQRTAMDNEAQQLTQEFQRIVSTTQFNGINLLDGSNPSISIQVGTGKQGSIAVPLAALASAGTTSTSTPTGTFQASISTPAINESDSIATGDFNGDGKLDIVTADYNTGNLIIRLGNGNGTLGASITLSGVTNQSQVTVADINGDGKADLVTSDDNGHMFVLLGNGNGTFQAAITSSTGSLTPTSNTIGDFNGDGKLDILVGGHNNGAFGVLLGNGNGTFKAIKTTAALEAPDGVISADLNGDGILDVLYAHGSDHGIDYALGNGDGTFKASSNISVTGIEPSGITVGDVNGDGKADIVFTDSNYGDVLVALGTGGGNFAAPAIYASPGGGASSPVLGDFNGDGKLDIAVADSNAHQIAILIGNGNGTFQAQKTYATSASPFQLIAGDFNGDGVKDIISLDYSSTEVLLANTNTTTGTSGALLSGVSLLTTSSALSSLDTLTSVKNTVEQALAGVGASQSRLAIAYSYVVEQRDELLTAASHITDADIAADSASLVREQILQQAATAVLAQANQDPVLALKLLQ